MVIAYCGYAFKIKVNFLKEDFEIVIKEKFADYKESKEKEFSAEDNEENLYSSYNSIFEKEKKKKSQKKNKCEKEFDELFNQFEEEYGNNLVNIEKNNDLKDVKSTATFFYFNSENKDIKTQKVYQNTKNRIMKNKNKVDEIDVIEKKIKDYESSNLQLSNQIAELTKQWKEMSMGTESTMEILSTNGNRTDKRNSTRLSTNNNNNKNNKKVGSTLKSVY